MIPLPRRIINRIPPLEPSIRDNNLSRRTGESNGDDIPFISNQNPQRQPRPGDVNASASLPQYNRPNEREYPVSTRKRTGPSGSSDAGSYVGHSPEHEPPLPYVEYFTSVSIFIWTGGCSIDTLDFYLCAYILTLHVCVLNPDLISLHLRFAYSMLE